MGSFFGGEKKTTTDSKPWEPQGNALKDIFNKAGSIYSSQEGTPWYTGDLYEGMDPQTVAAINSLVSKASTQGQQSADQITGTGQQLADPSKLQGAMDQFSAAASADPTQSNIAAATAYANNPAINGMIDAASRDVTRNLYEGQIPSIDRAASAGGNINSSRAGVAQGIAMRGAQDQIGDISASIRGDAFNRGLALAEGARSTNLGAMGQSAGLYGDSLNTGLNALTSGNNLSLANYGAAIDASKMFQQDRQGQLDADFMRWQGNDTRATDLLNRYYGIIGANNWGGTQTTTEKNSGNIFGKLVGAASTAASLGLFSDPRLKENIVKVGELEDGLGVYEYDYIWGEHSQGVMADEVENLRPWAMGPTLGGFKTVNYAAL